MYIYSSHCITSYILLSIVVRVVCCLVSINTQWIVFLLLFVAVTATGEKGTCFYVN